jgi:hypothetical protein
MANEITLTLQTLLNNGGISDSHASGSFAVDQASAKMLRNVQEIGTTREALQLGDVTTPGYCVFINLDDTNFVEIGVEGFIDGVGTVGFIGFLKLKPGEQCLVRLTTTAPYAKADTAAVELFYIMYQD